MVEPDQNIKNENYNYNSCVLETKKQFSNLQHKCLLVWRQRVVVTNITLHDNVILRFSDRIEQAVSQAGQWTKRSWRVVSQTRNASCDCEFKPQLRQVLIFSLKPKIPISKLEKEFKNNSKNSEIKNTTTKKYSCFQIFWFWLVYNIYLCMNVYLFVNYEYFFRNILIIYLFYFFIYFCYCAISKYILFWWK